MANVDLKLQELLLEIESEDNVRGWHSSCPSTSILGSSSNNNPMISGAFLNGQYGGKITNEPTSDCCSNPPTTMEMDVIDLSSPGPKKSEDKAPMANGDPKLQDLLLEIEADDHARREHSSCPSTSTLRSCSKNNSMISRTFLNRQSESKITNELAGICCLDPAITMEMDVIDLLSPGPKMSEDKVSMANVDLKLKELLPETNSEDSVRKGHSLCLSTSTSRSSSKDNSMVSDTFHDEQYESKIINEPTSKGCPDPPTTIESDMINLLSPSPEPSKRYVSRCQGNAERVNVIDLSDSDMEVSPEHAQKAKELRVFLASIREEIY